MTSPTEQRRVRFEVDEQLARYILALLDVDDYEHSPNDYETARLRRNVEEQIRASEPLGDVQVPDSLHQVAL